MNIKSNRTCHILKYFNVNERKNGYFTGNPSV
jgi:hypothetical protein